MSRASSSSNIMKAITLLATMSTLSEGFVMNAQPNRIPYASTVDPRTQSSRHSGRGCIQCEMVMMDIDEVVGESSYNADIKDKKGSDLSMSSLPKISGYQTGRRKHSRGKSAATTLKLVDKQMKENKKKESNVHQRVSSLKVKRASIKKVHGNTKAKSQKLQLVAPSKERIIFNEKTSVEDQFEIEEVDPLLASLAIEASKSNAKKKPRSRSSTMPGMAYHNTTRMKAYQDGLDIVEQKTGLRIRNTNAIESKRKSVKKANSEQMYGQSASVPDSLIQFVSEIHQENRITPQEELDLGSKTQEAIRLQNLYGDLEDKLKREPTDAEYCAAAGKINMEALRQTIDEGVEAKNRLVTSNLRMVQRVVNLYLRNGLGSEYNAGDLMQDGVVALIRAAEKFEPQRGFRFSTYAMYWIRSSVKRSQILQSRVIDVPQRLHEHYKKIQKFQKEHFDIYGHEAELKDIAEAVNLSELQVERCINALEQRIYSLDAEITNPMKTSGGNNNKETMYNLIHNKFDDVEMATVDSQLMKQDLIRSLRKHLNPHEVDLLLLRYGLIDEKTLPHGFSGPLTITEVSRLVGLKPDKVRRMLNNTLRQLKHVIGSEWEKEAM